MSTFHISLPLEHREAIDILMNQDAPEKLRAQIQQILITLLEDYDKLNTENGYKDQVIRALESKVRSRDEKLNLYERGPGEPELDPELEQLITEQEELEARERWSGYKPIPVTKRVVLTDGSRRVNPDGTLDIDNSAGMNRPKW